MLYNKKERCTKQHLDLFLEEGKRHSVSGIDFSVILMPGANSKDYIMEYFPYYHYEVVDHKELVLVIYNHFRNEHGIELNKKSIASTLNYVKKNVCSKEYGEAMKKLIKTVNEREI